jgi:YegS/Rv2252/BmrU family lipid kinase
VHLARRRAKLNRTGRNRRAVLIGNLRSRQTSELFSVARRLLTGRGVSIVEQHSVRGSASLRRSVRAAVRAGFELILVGGGDGTMTSIVGCLAHTRAVLGVLPFGTGNSFAQSLGIKPNVESAVDVIVDGRVEKVDLGIVNGTHFANFATIGLSSAIARNTPTWLKKVLGPAAYAVAGVGPMFRSGAFRATIRCGAQKIDIRTHQVIVANGRYYGTTPVLPDATIVDGTLSLFTTSGLTRWEVARMFVAFFRGEQTELADADYLSAPEITVKAKPKQYLDIDGEALGKTPARFSIDRRALRVMVPPGFTGR